MIDLHRHLWPDGLVVALAARTRPPFLDGRRLVTTEGAFEVDLDALRVEGCLRDLDERGLDIAVVSLQPTLGIEALPEDEAAELYAAYDDGVARVVARSAGRLRAFAAGGVRPGFAGVCVSAAALLDPDRLAPLVDELARRGQILFVHPGPATPHASAPAWWGPAVDYTAQMQAAYAAWVAYGAARRPELSVVFAILAGGAPFQLERLQSRGVDTRLVTGTSVYFDTASYGRRSFELCLATFGVGRLVYGSDAPVIDAGPTLAAVQALGDATADAICNSNPAALLAA